MPFPKQILPFLVYATLLLPSDSFQSPSRLHSPQSLITRLSVLRRPSDIESKQIVEETEETNVSRFPSGMMDLTQLLGREPADGPELATIGGDDVENESSISPASLALPVVGALLLLGAAVAQQVGLTPQEVASTAVAFTQNPTDTLQSIIDNIQAMGPAAPLYYGFFYVLCEMLAVPATPLALSAGYLFGLEQGTAVVLGAGTIAACIGFGVGRTLLRNWVEGILSDNPKLQSLDRAIGKEGFKLLVLVRLSPIFPFALANYVYGASSVGFSSFFWGTFLGFTPGTIAYVYTGMVGKEILFGEGSQPWYVYAGGLAVLGGILKLITDVASGIVETMDDDIESVDI